MCYSCQALGPLGNGKCHPFNAVSKAPWQDGCGEQRLGAAVLTSSIIVLNHSLSCCSGVDSARKHHHWELEVDLRQTNGRCHRAHKRTRSIIYRWDTSWGCSELLGGNIGAVGRNSCPAFGERWEEMLSYYFDLPIMGWEIQVAGVLQTLLPQGLRASRTTSETHTPQEKKYLEQGVVFPTQQLDH